MLMNAYEKKSAHIFKKMTRVDPTSTEHRGRTFVAVSRATGKTVYSRVANKKVKKGAPTPPETVEEVWSAFDNAIGPKAVLAADGGKAWQACAKKKKLGPVASASHQQKQYVQVVKVPAPANSGAKQLLQKLGHPGKRSLRVKGGDQRAESALSAVKHTLRRRNGLHNGRHAGSNMLSAAFLRHHPGLKPLGQAVRDFLQSVVDKEDPETYWVVGEQHEGDEAVN